MELKLNMPRAGIEPAQDRSYRFLRPTRLPVPPPRHMTRKYIRVQSKVNHGVNKLVGYEHNTTRRIVGWIKRRARIHQS